MVNRCTPALFAAAPDPAAMAALEVFGFTSISSHATVLRSMRIIIQGFGYPGGKDKGVHKRYWPLAHQVKESTGPQQGKLPGSSGLMIPI